MNAIFLEASLGVEESVSLGIVLKSPVHLPGEHVVSFLQIVWGFELSCCGQY